MTDELMKLGFSKKEAEVYLALLEFGNQTASIIAKRTKLPRPTVLFLFNNLHERGYIRKSHKGRTQYFYADPKFLEEAKKEELREAKVSLEKTIPLLQEFKNPFTSPPKIQFFEGLDNCRKAYWMLAKSETEVYEFAAHNDLIRMGEDFMEDFVKERSGNNVFIHSIAKRTKLHEIFDKKNKAQKRTLKLYKPELGDLYSSIAVFENKVLLLNLYHDAFAILIESKEVAESLKTIHKLAGIGI